MLKKRPPLPKITCLWCGEEFIPKRKWQKYDTKECRWLDWEKNHPRVAIAQKP